LRPASICFSTAMICSSVYRVFFISKLLSSFLLPELLNYPWTSLSGAGQKLGMTNDKWARLLAYVTGLVNQQLLLQNEYLGAENRIPRAHLPTRLRLSNPQRSTLAEIGKRLGRKALEQVACVAKPDTILAWYRRLIAQKFDGSRQRSYPGR